MKRKNWNSSFHQEREASLAADPQAHKAAALPGGGVGP